MGRLTNTVILSPHPVSIGNASEEYYFGLIKARKERKKLLVLFPYSLPGRLKQPSFDPGVLFLHSDLLAIRFRSPVSCFLSGVFTLYFLVVIVAIKTALKFVRFEPSGYYFRPLAGQDILWRPNANVTSFDWDAARAQNWEAQLSIPLQLSLPKAHQQHCTEQRQRLGLPNSAWFVCLHVREGGYKGDSNNIRNADISSYLGAIAAIVQRGGWVVRMGDPSMSKLPQLDRVIDYAHSPVRSAIMDVYLLKECCFFVGTSSGILDTAFLLNKPVVLTNMTSWLNVLPERPDSLTIFKHVFSTSQNRFLSLQEWLLKADMVTGDHLSSPDWRLVDNTEEEITGVVVEKLNAPADQSPTGLQNEFKKIHLQAARVLSETLRFGSSDHENCSEWFRFASRLLTWRGQVSADFLERNWTKSSRNSTDSQLPCLHEHD